MQAGGVQAFDLFIDRDQHLAALVAAFLGAGTLVLDVVAGDAHFDEAADQVADMGIAAVAGVGIGDDKGAEVQFRCVFAFFLAHARAKVLLVLVRGQQGADDGRGFIGDLAQGVAGQIGTGVFGDRTLGGGGPAAQVDSLDAQAFYHDGLAGAVGSEGGDG